MKPNRQWRPQRSTSSEYQRVEGLSQESQNILKGVRQLYSRSRRSGIFLLLFGLGCLAIVISFYNQFHMSWKSTLGIVAGLVVAGIVFRFMQVYRVRSYAKLLSDDVSDEDILAWVEETYEVDRRFLEQLQRGGMYIVLPLVVVLFVLPLIEATREFGIMCLFTGLTSFILGLGAFQFIVWWQVRWMNSRNS